MLRNQLGHAVAALARALGALDAEHFELALDVAEDKEITSDRPMLRRFPCNNHAVQREGRQLTALPLSVTYPACL